MFLEEKWNKTSSDAEFLETDLMTPPQTIAVYKKHKLINKQRLVIQLQILTQKIHIQFS